MIAWGVSDYEKVAQRFGFAEAPPAAASDATPAVNPAAGPPLAAVPPPTEPPSVPAEPVAAPAEGQPGGVVGADPSAADPTAAEPPDGVGAAGVDPPAGGEPAEPANAGSSATEGLDTRGLVSAGDRALAQGDTAAAEAYFQAALERDPRENHAMAGLAEANLARRDAANAIEWARKAVERRPRRASYQLLLGDALALGGQTAAARQAWQRAAELDSDSPARARLERP